MNFPVNVCTGPFIHFRACNGVTPAGVKFRFISFGPILETHDSMLLHACLNGSVQHWNALYLSAGFWHTRLHVTACLFKRIGPTLKRTLSIINLHIFGGCLLTRAKNKNLSLFDLMIEPLSTSSVRSCTAHTDKGNATEICANILRLDTATDICANSVSVKTLGCFVCKWGPPATEVWGIYSLRDHVNRKTCFSHAFTNRCSTTCFSHSFTKRCLQNPMDPILMGAHHHREEWSNEFNKKWQ